MNLIVLSNPTRFEREHEIINALFEEGLETFHIRKPEFGKDEMEEYIKGIQPKYIKQTVIHSHYILAGKYNVKGIHFPEKIRLETESKDIINTAKKRRLSISTSVHQIEEISECKLFDYVFLSPVYTSISKPAHKASFGLEEFRNWRESNKTKTKVIALGGIEETKIEELERLKFDGIALLGVLWNQNFSIKEIIDKYTLIQSMV